MFETGDIIASEDVSHWLGEVQEIVLMGATAGREITNAIERYTEEGKLARAAVIDAVASEVTDAALDWIMSYLMGMIHREGKTLMAKRYSPGYGDLGLETRPSFIASSICSPSGLRLLPK